MVKRKRVGLRFSYNENWIAGTYYILNIIHALNTLNKNEKPILIILTENETNFNFIKKETGYLFLEFFEYPYSEPKKNIVQRGVNKVSRFFLNRNVFVNFDLQPNIEFLYPLQINQIRLKKLKRINWIPDFQEHYLPQFFF